MSRKRPDGPEDLTPRNPEESPGSPPEAESPEEALLLQAWAAGIPDEEDLPEEVLGLLDGTLAGAEAESARRRLAADPSLARAAGGLLASLRETAANVEPREAPARLFAEVADLVPVEPPRARGWRERLGAFLDAARVPALAAAGAAILLVTFVLQERDPATPPTPVVRSGDPAPLILTLTSPNADARVRGDLTLTWEPVEGALRYRVVLVESTEGEVLDAGHTEGTSLVTPAGQLAGHFGDAPTLTLYGIVRARLVDGSEVSSPPRRIVWSAH